MAGIGKQVQKCGLRRDNSVILLTVGTSPFQFDRLVMAVDMAIAAGVVEDQVFAQLGCCTYRPLHMDYVAMLEKKEFDTHFRNARAIIGHAGMGTISMALDRFKPLLVMPRLKRHKEHVNNHQLGTARWFEKGGHLLAAYEADQVTDRVRGLSSFEPSPRVASPERVASEVGAFLRQML